MAFLSTVIEENWFLVHISCLPVWILLLPVFVGLAISLLMTGFLAEKTTQACHVLTSPDTFTPSSSDSSKISLGIAFSVLGICPVFNISSDLMLFPTFSKLFVLLNQAISWEGVLGSMLYILKLTSWWSSIALILCICSYWLERMLVF